MGGIDYSDDDGIVRIRKNRDGFPKWEYKTCYTDADFGLESFQQEGDKCWELVSIVPAENDWSVKAYIFKRPNMGDKTIY